MPRRPLVLTAFVLAAALLPGCADLRYYAQSIRGQTALLARREPIPRLLHAADTPPALKARLARVLEIRAFASRELALPDNASYRSYVAVDRPYLTWVVFAAPALSLKPVHWCYPVVGCAVYRGYFHRSAAAAFAARLRRDGDDVYVGGVPAYSTLGWFADPLPSTVIDWPVPKLAGLIFHELAHQELFVPGDSRFDESFAVAVQEAGVRRWLQAHGTPAERAAWCAARRRQAVFRALIDAARARLAAVYAGARPNGAKRAIKERIFARLTRDYRALKRSWGGYAGYDRWFEGGMNNAKLVALQTYDEYVPAFRRLLAAAHGDFPAFYATARALAKLPKARRDAVLAALAGDARSERCHTDPRRRPVGRGLPGPTPPPTPIPDPRRAGLGPPTTFDPDNVGPGNDVGRASPALPHLPRQSRTPVGRASARRRRTIRTMSRRSTPPTRRPARSTAVNGGGNGRGDWSAHARGGGA